MSVPDDPGGSGLQVSNYVTIPNRSDMDTEGSVLDSDCSINTKNSASKRRRTSSRKICKHCNKRRRNQKSNTALSENDCQCINNFVETVIQSPETNSILMGPPSVPHAISSESSLPSLSRQLYQSSDASPFVVHIQKEQTDPKENCSIHPVSFGHFLKKNSFRGIVNGSLKKIGRNRVTLSFTNFEDANSFVQSQQLKLNRYKAFVPTFNLIRMGIVRGVPADWCEDEVIKNMTVPIGCGNIIKVRRLKRKQIINEKTEFIPIETVVNTIDGQILPKRVFLCYNSLPVDLYIFPTIQCFNCCRYGHIKSQCRSTPKCFKCGQGHSGDSCSVDEELIVCFLCSGSHFATSRKCPEYSRQKSIKESMAKSCISYSEALKLHPPVSKSYSDILTSQLQKPISSQIISNNFNSISSDNKTSYKKTVLLNKKVSSKPRFGYDQHAHAMLTKNYDMNLPTTSRAYSNNISLTEISIKELILTLINTLNQTNFISLPSNVASKDFEINNNNKNIHSGSTHNIDTVEL
jgi:hypothetical protein